MSETTQTMAADRRLEGKVAVITGASSGIGEATARELARLGASVVLAARRLDQLQAVVKDIEAAGGTAYPVVTDTTKSDDLARMVEVAIRQYNRLDYAVNNAGASGRGAFMDVKVEDFDRVMETNLRGVFLAMQAEIPALLATGGGAIVNTASVGGLVGVPGLSSYVASKWALIGLTKSVALEYATQNIRINAIAPGATATEMSASWTPAQREFMSGLAPMKRICEPVEIARGIVYLLADATFTTGIALPADGGQSVPYRASKLCLTVRQSNDDALSPAESQQMTLIEPVGTAIGLDRPRVDALEKVTGRAVYSADHPVERLAYAYLRTAPIGRGQIRGIDRRAAQTVAGVLAIMTHEDVGQQIKPGKVLMAGGYMSSRVAPLETNRIQFAAAHPRGAAGRREHAACPRTS